MFKGTLKIKKSLMKKVTKPTVKTLASGKKMIAKQMKAKAGDLLPKHLANVESILFVHEGECILKIHGEDKELKPGDAYIIPPEVKHQIEAKTDFRGIHFMPTEIKFEFFT